MIISSDFLTIVVTVSLTGVAWVFQAGQLKQQVYRDLDKIMARIELLATKDEGTSEINGLRLQNLQEKVDKLTLIVENEHQTLSNELRSRSQQIDKRLDDIEAYLMKSTDFVKRKNAT